MKSAQKKIKGHRLFKIICFITTIFFLNSCDIIERIDDDVVDDISSVTPTGRTATYSILNTDQSEITGTLTFIENENNSTTVKVVLRNNNPDINNVLFLRRQTANIGGKLLKVLNPVDGVTGVSNTVVSELVDNEEVTYEDFLDFDGHITIGDSSESSGNVLAHVDLGPNELTGNEITYNLLAPHTGEFKGQVTIQERKNLSSAIIISIRDYEVDDEFPATLYNALSDSGREPLVYFPEVKGEFKGFGFSELNQIDDTPTTYNDLINLDAFIEVSEIDKEGNYAVIARGGIGNNADASIN